MAAACAVLIAASFVWAAPASADDQHACTRYGCDKTDGWGSGYAHWYAYGDKMRVCDSYADGWSVVVVAAIVQDNNGTPSSKTVYKWHTGGSGGFPCTDRSYGDLPEGTPIHMRTCLGNYTANIINADSCGEIKYAEA
jgi:hypothetical protein